MAKFVPVLFLVCTAKKKIYKRHAGHRQGHCSSLKGCCRQEPLRQGVRELVADEAQYFHPSISGLFPFQMAPRKLLRVSHCLPCRGRGVKAAGRVKKGGAGGKFTWGGLMSPGLDRAPSPVLDRNDPNYESGAVVYCHFGLNLALIVTVKFSLT